MRCSFFSALTSSALCTSASRRATRAASASSWALAAAAKAIAPTASVAANGASRRSISYLRSRAGGRASGRGDDQVEHELRVRLEERLLVLVGDRQRVHRVDLLDVVLVRIVHRVEHALD